MAAALVPSDTVTLEPPRADDASRVVVEPEAEDSVAELG